MSVRGDLTRWYYERGAKGQSYEDLQGKLQRNEVTTYSRMVNATEFPYNRRASIHVIGIERWSAHRLRVLLGEALVIDEYDGYAPSAQLSMAQLAEEFRQARATTKAIVGELQKNGVALTQTVLHNDLGDLSVGQWIFYIENHTGRETALIVQRLSNRVEVKVESY